MAEASPVSDIQAPGWYPDPTGSSLVWWNGSFYSFYTGQTWEELDPSTELFDVVLLDPGFGPHLALRGTLMRQLGMAKDTAKALVQEAPRVVATRLPLQVAEMLMEKLAQFGGSGGAEVHRTGLTAGGFLASVRGQQPVTTAAPDPRFAQVEAQVAVLRAQRGAGQITPEQLDQAAGSLAFESGGRWWTLGVNTHTWYASDGDAWVPMTPPGR